MSFIAKNPLILPKVDAPSSLPAGTRGLFAGEDGFYEIDSNNNISKLANINYNVYYYEDNPFGGEGAVYDELSGISQEGIYKIFYNYNGDYVIGILKVGYYDVEGDNSPYQIFVGMNNDVYRRFIGTSDGWEKISVSQTDLNEIKKMIKNMDVNISDKNGNVLLGKADSHSISENSQNNVLEGENNSVGIAKLPAIVGDVHEETVILQSNYEEFLNLNYVRFKDFVYSSSLEYDDDSGDVISYIVTQIPIKTINGYTKENENLINYNKVTSISLDFTEETEFYRVPYVLGQDYSFTFSNPNVLINYDTLMEVGNIENIVNSHVEGKDNTVISSSSSGKGRSNQVGCRGYQILSCEEVDMTTGKYFLNSIEGLSVGDVYSVIFNSFYINQGKILEIDIDNMSITVSNYLNEWSKEGHNHLFIVSKPFLGTEDIGQFANAKGLRNIALLQGANASGKYTQAIGRFSRADGLNAVAKGYGAIAEGKGVIATKAYQRVAGRYNIEDVEEEYLDIVGCGSDDNDRKNAYTLDKNGNASFLGTMSGKDVLISSNLDSISIFGDTKMLEKDASSVKTISNIQLNNQNIYTLNKPIDLNGITDNFKDEIIINNKLKVKRWVQKIVLGYENLYDSGSKQYGFYQTKASIGADTKVFFINLESLKDSEGNLILRDKDIDKINNNEMFVQTYTMLCTHFPYYNRNNDATSYFKYTLLESESGKFNFRLYFYDENAIDIRKGNTYLNINENPGNGKHDIRTLPMIIYLTLLEPIEEELEGNYSVEWENFKNNYNINSKVIVNGQTRTQNSNLIEDAIISSKVNYMSIIDYINQNSGGNSSKEIEALKTALGDKVDKVDGKGLSTNDFTDELNFVNNNIFNDDDLFDGIITKDFDPDMEEGLTGFSDGTYKVFDTEDNFIGIVQGSTYYIEGYDYSFYEETFEDLEGNMWISAYEDGAGNGWSPYHGTYRIKLKDKLFENKVDKENGKGLISNELNMIVKNIIGDTDDLFDDMIVSNFNPESAYGALRGRDESGIFKVVDTKGNFIGILETEYYTDPSIHEDYYIVSEWFEDLNGVVWGYGDEDGSGYSDPWKITTWHKISLKDRFFASNKAMIQDMINEALANM